VTLRIGEDSITLPDSIIYALRNVVSHLERGVRVDIVPTDRKLTLREAGSLLGVSREFVRRLVASGELDASKVGTHHRLTLSDVLEYKERRDRRRRNALSELHDQSVELGAYDEPD
jgi:excisionase family DNA binding protein